MNRIVSKVKKYGIIGIWHYVKEHVLHIRILKLHYLKISIDYKEIQEELQSFDLDVKELTYDDFLLGDKSVFCKKKMELIKQRCADPMYKSYGLIENNILIYSTWISFEKLGLPVKSNYLLGQTEGLLEDSYCHPSARGKGIHGKMNLFRLAKVYEFGKTECLAIVLEGNDPAFKVQIRSGFKDLGVFYAGKIFGIPFSTLKKEKYGCR